MYMYKCTVKKICVGFSNTFKTKLLMIDDVLSKKGTNGHNIPMYNRSWKLTSMRKLKTTFITTLSNIVLWLHLLQL